MWEISPTLVRYDVVEPTSHAVATLGLKQLSSTLAAVNAKNAPFTKPIANFYQTDVVSRACVTPSIPDKNEGLTVPLQFCYNGAMHPVLCQRGELWILRDSS